MLQRSTENALHKKQQYITMRTLLLVTLFFPLILTAINPSKEYILTPDSLGLSYTQQTVTTSDGVRLNSWTYAPSSENDCNTVLILSYGDAGNMSYNVYHASAFAQAGFTVLTFDYRGFGKSDNFDIQKNYIYHTEFVKDLEAIIHYANKKFEDKKIGIWALSMGTVIATKAITEQKCPIDFMITEGFVKSPQQCVDRIKATKGKKVLLPEKSIKYERCVAKINVPLLVFASTQDVITTVQDAKELQGVIKSKYEYHTYEGGHLGGFQALSERGFGDKYIAITKGFIENI